MNPKFVLALLMVLTPTVSGCVNFGLNYVSNNNPGAYPISARLWDNRGQNDPPTCEYDGYVGDDGRYHFTCFEGDYAAFWTAPVVGPDSGVAEYDRPGQGFTFATPQTTDGDWQYGACVFGCTSDSCFIQGVTPT